MKAINPEPPPKPTDAFLAWLEQRQGLSHKLQSAASLERLRKVWEAERKG
jgi:hypothetical protein